MTTLSQYLRAERPDVTEPASFYAPGAESWSQKVKVATGMSARTRAPKEQYIPAEPEDVIEH